MVNKMIITHFNNREIRVAVEDSGNLWICMYDICCAIKRPHLLVTHAIRVNCKSACKIVFDSKANLTLWAIRPRDMEVFVSFVKNENARIHQTCLELVKWSGDLQFAILKKTHPISTAPEQIPLTKESSEKDIRRYFTTVLEISKSKNEYPIDFDEVWALVYSAKNKAVKELKDKFIENIDYQPVDQMVEHLNGIGSSKIIKYYLTVSCLEFFIARKIRPVFEIYRQVFHASVTNMMSAQCNNIPANFSEALRLAADQAEKIEQQNHLIELKDVDIDRMKPKEQYYDAVIQSRKHFSTSSIAGELGMSSVALVARLIKAGIVRNPATVEISTSWQKNIVTNSYLDWMEYVFVESNRRWYYQWTPKGRTGIFNLINPQMPQ